LIEKKSHLSIENKLLIYKAVIKHIWSYGIQLWGCASKSNIIIMQRSEYEILRAIANAANILCTAHNIHAILGPTATPPTGKLRRKLTECFNINITLARLNCKLLDYGRRPKHVGAIQF